MGTTIEREINNPDKLYSLASVLAKKVSDYFKDEEHRKKFEEWYKKEYGTEYVWRS